MTINFSDSLSKWLPQKMTSSPSESKPDPLAKLKIDRSPKDQNSNRKSSFPKIFAGFLVLCLLFGGFFFGKSLGWFGGSRSNGLTQEVKNWLEIPDIIKNRPEVRLVKVTVERGESADATVVATGYLESRRQAKIGARAAGRIQVVNVEEGNRVKKDEIMAILEHADLDASLSAVKASVVKARAAVSEQVIVIAQWKREYERMKQLVATQSISDSEFNQAEFQYESAVARMESLQADIVLAEARLKEAEQLKENMFIRAPFDGTVISKDAEVGESILPGGMGEASGRGSAVTIADLEHLEVDCDVKEDFISRIQTGQRTEVAVDAVPSKKYRGEVRKVIPMGDRARSTIKVKVAITDADERLFPDMSSTVYFLPTEKQADTQPDTNRIFCPADCVVSANGKEIVWTVNKQGHAQTIEVTTGRTKDNQVEILSGLQGTEKLVVKPVALVPDQAVKTIE